MRHVSGGRRSQGETDTEWARRLGLRSDHGRGLGYWTGFVGLEPVGWWGLGSNEVRAEAGELGFRLDRNHWRQGFGAEGARLVLDHAVHTADVTRVWAGTTRANAASRATLEKLGFTCVDEPMPGVLTYEISLDE